jgi:hypothetical protein
VHVGVVRSGESLREALEIFVILVEEADREKG